MDGIPERYSETDFRDPKSYFEKVTYRILDIGLLDYGPDFYATQSASYNDEFYLTAWLENWKERGMISQKKRQGRNGSFPDMRNHLLI